MADVTIDGTVQNVLDRMTINNKVWISSTTGYVIYANDGTELMEFRKTTDGGATWSTATTIPFGDDLICFNIWYDRWTNGQTGTKIHIAGIKELSPDIEYNSIDTSDDSVGVSGTAVTTETITGTGPRALEDQCIAIVKSRGGNLYVAYKADTTTTSGMTGFARSTDDGTTWADRADPYEATETDTVLLVYGNETDNQDVWAIYHDWSTDEITLKVYDNSADSWSETQTIATGVIDVGTLSGVSSLGIAVAPRFSNNGAVVALWDDPIAVGGNLEVYSVTSSSASSQLTNVVTSGTEHEGIGICVDQVSDDYYVVYTEGSGFTALNVRYRISTDQGITWGSVVQFQDSAAGRFLSVWQDPSINSNGGRFAPCWFDDTNDDLITNFDNSLILFTGTTFGILVDWPNDGNFVDITSDVLSGRWRRGQESEFANTPAGTLDLEVTDPEGDYSPENTGSRFGSGNVTVRRPVLVRVDHQGIIHELFRGHIESITPHPEPEFPSVSLRCADAFAIFNETQVSVPASGAATTGASPTGGIRTSTTVGGTVEDNPIDRILDAVGFSATLRNLSDPGDDTLDFWWVFKQGALDAIHDLETHEFRSRIFISSCGEVTFHDRTHLEGSVSQLTLTDTEYQRFDYEFAARSIRNVAELTAHHRELVNDSHLGFVNTTSLPTLANGSAFTFNIELRTAPVFTAQVPGSGTDGEQEVSIRNTAGTTTFEPVDGFTITGEIIGASLMQMVVTNNVGQTIAFFAPDIASPSDTDDTHQCFEVHSNAGSVFSDNTVTSSGRNTASVTTFGERKITLDRRFVKDQRVTEDLAGSGGLTADTFANPRADFSRLTIVGTESESRGQIFQRELGDRITVTNAHLGITSRDYYISAAEYELTPGAFGGVGGFIQAVWSLETAS